MTTEGQQAPPTPGELIELLNTAVQRVEETRTTPFTGNVSLNRDEFLALLYRLRELIPEELRAARWMVREREAFIARTNERARELLDRARDEAGEKVAHSNIVAEATEEANTLVRNAESEARQIRLEAEDYAEQRLAEAETVLGEIIRYLRSARGELHESRPAAPEPPVSE